MAGMVVEGPLTVRVVSKRVIISVWRRFGGETVQTGGRLERVSDFGNGLGFESEAKGKLTLVHGDR